MEIYYASVLRLNSHLKIPKNCNLEFDFHSLYLEPARTIDIEYNKRLDRQRPCLEGDLSGGSNYIVQSNKSV